MEISTIVAIIMNTPVLAKVLLSLAGILVINRICKNLILSVVIGTLVLAFWSGHDIRAVGLISWQRLTSINLILLLVVVFEVIVFSTQMSLTGVMKELVNVVQARATKRFSVALLPAMIGLLPMPGGALFSAPLVADCDEEEQMSPDLKTRINYWFRHIWEFWWPVYPGVLLAIEITRLSMWQFILLLLPLSLFSVTGGYIFLLRKVKNRSFDTSGKKEFSVVEFIKIILPILIIIFTIIFRLLIPGLSRLNKYIPLLTGILIAMISLQIMRPLGFKEWKKILLSKRIWLLVLIVTIIRIYGAFIETELPGGVPLVQQMRMELDTLGIPLIAIIILLPFIAGMASGIAIGFVGASFPIVINILGPEPSLGMHLATTLLAYGSGYLGMMLSPVHVCYIVTNEYFKTRLLKNIAGLIKPASIVFVGIILIYLLIRFVLFP